MKRGRRADTQVQHVFTVFTATFNRAHVLHRVYHSLRAQTFRDFEWLVVDDGSTDGTGALVEAWRAEADFPIRYRYQENRGKHVACNRAVAEARGRFFLTLDSDDACVPQAFGAAQSLLGGDTGARAAGILRGYRAVHGRSGPHRRRPLSPAHH